MDAVSTSAVWMDGVTVNYKLAGRISIQIIIRSRNKQSGVVKLYDVTAKWELAGIRSSMINRRWGNNY